MAPDARELSSKHHKSHAGRLAKYLKLLGQLDVTSHQGVSFVFKLDSLALEGFQRELLRLRLNTVPADDSRGSREIASRLLIIVG